MPPKTDIVSPEFYHRYINEIREDQVGKAIESNTKAVLKALKRVPHKKINFAYADGKWTIKEMLQHIIDSERVFTYRALSFSRNDGSVLPGFDENGWAKNASVADRKWKDMVSEFKDLRKATTALFDSFTPEQLLLSGSANSNVVNVKALGFIVAGHAAHHLRILKERYLVK